MTPEIFEIYNVASQRQALFKHIAKLEEFDVLFWREFTQSPTFNYVRSLRQRIDDFHTFLCIHNRRQELIGFGAMAIYDNDSPRTADLCQFYLIESERGKGIWTRGIAVREKIAIANGAKFITALPHNDFQIPTLMSRGYQLEQSKRRLYRLTVT